MFFSPNVVCLLKRRFLTLTWHQHLEIHVGLVGSSCCSNMFFVEVNSWFCSSEFHVHSWLLKARNGSFNIGSDQPQLNEHVHWFEVDFFMINWRFNVMIMLIFAHFRREDDVINVFVYQTDRLTSYFLGGRGRLFNGNLNVLLFTFSLTWEVLEEYQLAYDKFGRYGGSAVQNSGGWQRFWNGVVMRYRMWQIAIAILSHTYVYMRLIDCSLLIKRFAVYNIQIEYVHALSGSFWNISWHGVSFPHGDTPNFKIKVKVHRYSNVLRFAPFFSAWEHTWNLEPPIGCKIQIKWNLWILWSCGSMRNVTMSGYRSVFVVSGRSNFPFKKQKAHLPIPKSPSKSSS